MLHACKPMNARMLNFQGLLGPVHGLEGQVGTSRLAAQANQSQSPPNLTRTRSGVTTNPMLGLLRAPGSHTFFETHTLADL